MRYEFATAQRIVVGPGSSAELADSIRELGGRALLVQGSGMAARGGLAAALAAQLAALDYMEVVGAGRPLERTALPVIAVPTTAGTGSEATRNAVVAAPEHRAKASIRHPSLLPRLALVDSTLTHDLPPHLTASSGLD